MDFPQEGQNNVNGITRQVQVVDEAPESGKGKPLVSNVPLALRREFYKHVWPVPIYGCMTYKSSDGQQQACCPLFAEACLCPALVLGRNGSLLQREPFVNKLGLGPKGSKLCQTVCISQLLTFWLGCGWPLCGTCILIQRSEIKAKYNIAGKESCWHGCLKPFCCYSCALFQENVFLREQDQKRKMEAVEGVLMEDALVSPLAHQPPTVQELHREDLAAVATPSERTVNLETATTLSGASQQSTIPQLPTMKGKEEIMKMHLALEDSVEWKQQRTKHERYSSIDLNEDSEGVTPGRSFNFTPSPRDVAVAQESQEKAPQASNFIGTESIKSVEEIQLTSSSSLPASRNPSLQQPEERTLSNKNNTIIISSALSLVEYEDNDEDEEDKVELSQDQKGNMSNTI